MAGQIPVDEAVAARLRLIVKAGEELRGADLLSFVLEHAVTECGGLGGMVHLRGPGGRELLLTTAHGLVRTIAGGWAEIGVGNGTAPALAVTRGLPVWLPARPGEDGTGAVLPAGTGLLAVPLTGTDGTVAGALSVLATAEEPGPGCRAALAELAGWTGPRLPDPRESPPEPWRGGGGPEHRIAPDSVSRALWHMSDAFFAVDAQWRITFVNVEAERLLGASHALLGHTLWEAFTRLGVDIAEPGLPARYRRAAEAGAPSGFEVRWPTNQRWYYMRLVPVPDGLAVYAADITETRAREEERAAAERAAAERGARLGELTDALAQALTMREVVTAIADRVLPPFGASGFVVQLIEGSQIQVAGGVGYPQSFLEAIDGSPIGDLSAVSEVYHTGAPVFIDSVEEFARRYPTQADRPFSARKAAWAFLPLVVSGRDIGCSVISFAEPRHLTGEERALLNALSGLMAQAIERARLYDMEHTRAKELQRGLLPRTLPTVHAVTTAARYLPASEGVEVGGDWYDVIPLSGARVALVIGDVMGHGLSEAATMGRLRTAVHTLADLEFPPAELLTRLNDLVSDFGDSLYATCLYAVYDPVTATCSYARAGHPPPAVVRPGEPVRFPGHAPDPPLGAARPPFETTEVSLPEGSLLVLYTDGLVESAARDIDRGMEHLARTLTAAASGPGSGPGALHIWRKEARGESASLERLCDDLLAELVPEKQGTADDAALLIARTHAIAPDDIATWPLSPGPVAAGEARDHVREQLLRWELAPLTTTAELLVSELVGNAVRHGKGPVELRLLRGDGLICEVSDGSLTTPRIRHASETDEGGRGLQLVSALSHRWGTRYTAAGKCIWTEQRVP
ncbi:ATP-binding SpoIIE family protein phosphatase [Streptomyces sp. NEAU-Y11]|uniref:ATP-binding SpoIIE family protein phosphatase n=1 Tax=Streptomyces cucumeris TaxID=2962890 RepID=UPI0020C8EF26|nr:SpoIIE family protein phosphatase [Streptomyces sp. NEAU-Y11]MCP9208852.1 SpoIIE family protein phosphatase [Streptomyces sp. NEAU-Y11]